MVWENALPGSRVVRYPNIFRGRNYNCQRACRAENLAVTWIAQTCREARGVVQANLNKLPLALSPLNKSPLPFVYINFDLDTLLLEWYTLVDESSMKLLSPLLGKLKKLVLPLMQLEKLDLEDHYMKHLKQSNFEALQQLTFVEFSDLQMRDHHEKWEMLEVDLSQPCLLQWPADGLHHFELYDIDEFAHVIEKHGELALFQAKAKLKAHLFNEFKEKSPEWKNLTFSFSALVVKKPGSSQWCLRYYAYEPDELGDHENLCYDDDCDCLKGHHHLEPIELGDGTLYSCRPATVDSWLTPNYMCKECAKRRWIIYNDMFWVRGREAGNTESSATDISSEHQGDLENISAGEYRQSLDDDFVDDES